MFFLVLIVLLGVFFWALIESYKKEKNDFNCREQGLAETISKKKKNKEQINEKIEYFDKKTSQLFAFYDITRLISSIFDKKEIIRAFTDKISSLEGVERVSLDKLDGPNCHRFKLRKEGDDYLYIDTRSSDIFGLFPVFAKLLTVCFERLNLYRRLQDLSIHDYLTNTYNRRFFNQRLEEEFGRAKELDHSLSFLMLDVDNFKQVNDTYGHLVGDVVLRKCVSLISESIRQIDFVGRLGGEEFGILLLDTDKAGAIMVGERICSHISQEKIRAFDERLSITASIGIATYPSNTIYIDLLSEIADKALYRAKTSGKDQVSWF